MINFFIRAVIILTFIFLSFSFNKVSAQGSVNMSLHECWKFETTQSENLKIASDNASELFFSLEGNLQAVNLLDRKIHWKTELGGEVISNILYKNEKIFIITKSNLQKEREKKKEEITVRSISSLTGLPIWKQTFEITSDKLENKENIGQIDLIVNDNFLNLVLSSGEIIILEKLDGKVNKQISLDSELSSAPIIASQKIYIGTVKKGIQYLYDGKISILKGLNFYNIAKVIYVSGYDDKDYLFIADQLGIVYCFSLVSRKMVWKTRTGAEVIGIKEERGFLLVSSNDNFIYSISQKNGNIKWKKRLAGRSEFAISDDQTLLFLATVNSDTLTVSKSDKGNTINQIFLPDTNYFVSSPLLIKDFVVTPTNSGFSVYNTSDIPCSIKN